MPTLEHNGLVEMFRENPALAPHLLALLFHVDVPAHASVRVADSALDQEAARREVELAVLSAMAHGNGPRGRAVLEAAFGALSQLDRDHAAVYFQIIWNVLREPMQQALEALVMERQTEGKATFPPFAQKLIDRGFRDGELKGLHDGKLEGLRDGELKGLRETLLRLTARAGIPLAEEERARVLACEETEVLERWIENVLGAKTPADVFS